MLDLTASRLQPSTQGSAPASCLDGHICLEMLQVLVAAGSSGEPCSVLSVYKCLGRQQHLSLRCRCTSDIMLRSC